MEGLPKTFILWSRSWLSRVVGGVKWTLGEVPRLPMYRSEHTCAVLSGPAISEREIKILWREPDVLMDAFWYTLLRIPHFHAMTKRSPACVAGCLD